MSSWQRFSILFTALVVVDVVTPLVLDANLRAEVYPVEADSIGIPILETWVSSVIVLPFLSIAAIVPRTKLFERVCLRNRLWSTLAALVLLAAYSVAIIFAFAGIELWASPRHYAVAVTYALLLALLLSFLFSDIRGLFSRSPKTSASPSGSRSAL